MARGTTLRMELFVRDLEASAAFYRDVLGFIVDDEQADYIGVRNGDVTFGLGLQDRLPPNHVFSQAALNAQKGTGVEIVLEVDDVEACYQRVVEANYPIARSLGDAVVGIDRLPPRRSGWLLHPRNVASVIRTA